MGSANRTLCGRPINKDVLRFQVGWALAWFQRQYRRVVVRWDRLASCFNALLAIAVRHMWGQRLIVT
jgi:hypothetical protein